ncbi:protein of unknown function [Cupriavidus neocaledonicus]|uniref:Uncharacterized protein n=1 Tax=Cupriavidus neocaledonicus TaxID=1040979 RepID=A0A375H2D2_9BURK|nr:hypothetical protein CBM2605_A60124 [Cupriavidus neocaledonicus]SPD45455.1 protein of unknown function [Cupriavidus neocaledonicus]
MGSVIGLDLAPPCAIAKGAASTLAASNNTGIAFLVFIVISLRTGKPNCRRIRQHLPD